MKNTKFISVILMLFLSINLFAQDDWANLKKFQNANEELCIPTNDENRVVFMGNSITIGWLNKCPEFFNNRPYINRGISGQTTPQMLLRFRQDVIDLQPKVVVILAGTNDIAGNTGPSTQKMIEDNIANMAQLANANDIKVILCSVLPAKDYPWCKGLNPDQKIPALNKWIKEYAQNNGFIYVDYFSALTNAENGMDLELAYDGVHPTEAGYAIMAPLVEQAIAQALNK